MANIRVAHFLCAVFAAAMIALMSAPCAIAAEANDESAAQPILQTEVPSIPGPKRSVAVGQIDTIGGLSPPSAGWNVGGSLAAMLTTALQESGKFIVVERDALSQVLNEQQMAAHGVSGGSDAPQPGKIIPAQYLIVGSVTEFGTADKGGGVSVGGTSGLLSGGLAVGKTSGKVAIDFRIVDTRTSAVVSTFKVSREISSTNVGVTTNYQNISIGSNAFWNSPLGATTREAINDAVTHIAEAIAAGHWQGLVVEVDGDTVYVNAGSSSGLKVGDHLAVQHAGKTFTDPATGEVLSQHMTKVGAIEVNNVEEKLASGRYLPADPQQPERGDIVEFEQ